MRVAQHKGESRRAHRVLFCKRDRERDLKLTGERVGEDEAGGAYERIAGRLARLDPRRSDRRRD